MKKLKVIITGASLFALVLTGTLISGCGKKKSETPAPPPGPAFSSQKPVARVGETVITEGDLARAVNAYAQSLQQRGQQPPPGFQDSVLDILIESELLFQAGQKLEIPDLDKEVEARYKEISQRFPSEEVLGEQLARQGMTVDNLKENLKREVIVKNLLQDKVYDKVTVTDEEVEKYYQDNQDQLKQPARIHARHILIKVPQDATAEQKQVAKDKILALKKKIDEGAKFEDVAKESSEGPTGVKGGDLGYFGQGQMVKPFEEAAWSLATGVVSEPVETRFGYHLIMVEDKKPAGVPALDEIKDKIEAVLKGQKTSVELKKYVAELMKEVNVQKLTTTSPPPFPAGPALDQPGQPPVPAGPPPPRPKSAQ